MDKIIDLFNTPQMELTYIDQLTMALIIVVPLMIILAIFYFIDKKNKCNK